MREVGEEVLVKGKIIAVDSGKSGNPYWVGVSNGMGYWLSEWDITDKTYVDGLNDVWNLAKKIYDTTHADRNKIFGMDNSCNGIKNVFEMFTPQEALAKIEAYDKEKSVCVGDVVECNGFKGVVLHIFHSGTLNIVYENGIIDTLASVQECEKTGKHIDIESLLRQIGE